MFYSLPGISLKNDVQERRSIQYHLQSFYDPTSQILKEYFHQPPNILNENQLLESSRWFSLYFSVSELFYDQGDHNGHGSIITHLSAEDLQLYKYLLPENYFRQMKMEMHAR